MSPRLTWPLGRTIALALGAKFLILWLLWLNFFAAPQTKKMRMPTPAVEQHLLGGAPQPPSHDKAKPHDAH